MRLARSASFLHFVGIVHGLRGLLNWLRGLLQGIQVLSDQLVSWSVVSGVASNGSRGRPLVTTGLLRLKTVRSRLGSPLRVPVASSTVPVGSSPVPVASR